MLSSTLTSLVKNAPVVGSIANSLSSIGGAIGVDTTSPAQHIATRIAAAAPIVRAAQSGDLMALDELWVRAGRPLPRTRGEPPPADPRVYTAAGLQNIGGRMVGAWPRVGPQLIAAYMEIVNQLGDRAWPGSGTTVGKPIQNLTLGVLPPGIGTPWLSLTAPVGSDGTSDGSGIVATAPAGSKSSANLAVVGLLILGALWLVKGR